VVSLACGIVRYSCAHGAVHILILAGVASVAAALGQSTGCDPAGKDGG